MFTRYSAAWAPGLAPLAITLLRPSKTARPRAVAIAGAKRPCSPEKIAMAALLKESYVAVVIEAEDIWLPKINSVPWDLLL